MSFKKQNKLQKSIDECMSVYDTIMDGTEDPNELAMCTAMSKSLVDRYLCALMHKNVILGFLHIVDDKGYTKLIEVSPMITDRSLVRTTMWMHFENELPKENRRFAIYKALVDDDNETMTPMELAITTGIDLPRVRDTLSFTTSIGDTTRIRTAHGFLYNISDALIERINQEKWDLANLARKGNT